MVDLASKYGILPSLHFLHAPGKSAIVFKEGQFLQYGATAKTGHCASTSK